MEKDRKKLSRGTRGVRRRKKTEKKDPSEDIASVYAEFVQSFQEDMSERRDGHGLRSKFRQAGSLQPDSQPGSFQSRFTNDGNDTNTTTLDTGARSRLSGMGGASSSSSTSTTRGGTMKVSPELTAEDLARIERDQARSSLSSARKKRRAKKESLKDLMAEMMAENAQAEIEGRHRRRNSHGSGSSTDGMNVRGNGHQSSNVDLNHNGGRSRSGMLVGDSSSERFVSREEMTRSTNLYVGNLPMDVTEAKMTRLFSRYGPVSSVKIMWPRSEEERRRIHLCGFVSFVHRADAEHALNRIVDGDITFNGDRLRIGWAKQVAPHSEHHRRSHHNNNNHTNHSHPNGQSSSMVSNGNVMDSTSQGSGGASMLSSVALNASVAASVAAINRQLLLQNVLKANVIDPSTGSSIASQLGSVASKGASAGSSPALPNSSSAGSVSAAAASAPSSSASTLAASAAAVAAVSQPPSSSISHFPSQLASVVENAGAIVAQHILASSVAARLTSELPTVPSGSDRIRVRIPEDPVMKAMIDECAMLVSEYGSQFEKLIKKWISDLAADEDDLQARTLAERFSFVMESDPDCDAHLYYRWRCISLCNGDSLVSWRVTPFQMISTGPYWIPPPIPEVIRPPAVHGVSAADGSGRMSSVDHSTTTMDHSLDSLMMSDKSSLMSSSHHSSLSHTTSMDYEMGSVDSLSSSSSLLIKRSDRSNRSGVLGLASGAEARQRLSENNQRTLLRLLGCLQNCERREIRKIMVFCMDNALRAGHCVETICNFVCASIEQSLNRMKESDGSKFKSSLQEYTVIKAVLFVMSDILYNASRVSSGVAVSSSSSMIRVKGASAYPTEFRKRLRKVFDYLFQFKRDVCKDSRMKQLELSRLVDDFLAVWTNNLIFTTEFTIELKSIFNHGMDEAVSSSMDGRRGRAKRLKGAASSSSSDDSCSSLMSLSSSMNDARNTVDKGTTVIGDDAGVGPTASVPAAAAGPHTAGNNGSGLSVATKSADGKSANSSQQGSRDRFGFGGHPKSYFPSGDGSKTPLKMITVTSLDRINGIPYK